jgi:hypothetical protein
LSQCGSTKTENLPLLHSNKTQIKNHQAEASIGASRFIGQENQITTKSSMRAANGSHTRVANGSQKCLISGTGSSEPKSGRGNPPRVNRALLSHGTSLPHRREQEAENEFNFDTKNRSEGLNSRIDTASAMNMSVESENLRSGGLAAGWGYSTKSTTIERLSGRHHEELMYPHTGSDHEDTSRKARGTPDPTMTGETEMSDSSVNSNGELKTERATHEEQIQRQKQTGEK